jgi:YD repeat-containing protein
VLEIVIKITQEAIMTLFGALTLPCGGFGKKYTWSTENTKLVCTANYPQVSTVARCPSGWVAYSAYLPEPDPNPVYYCGLKPGKRPGSNNNTRTPDGPSNADKSGNCNACGINPVNLMTRAKHDAVVDYQNYSPYPIKLVRYYTNRSKGWHFNYDKRVVFFQLQSSNKAMASILREDGTYLFFTSTNADPTTSSTSWTWEPAQSTGIKTVLSTFSVAWSSGVISGYTIKNLLGETEEYNGNGLLVHQKDTQGRQLDFTYDTKQRLSKVEDDYGRYLGFAYKNTIQSSNSWENEDPNEDPVSVIFNEWQTVLDQYLDTSRAPTSVTDGIATINYSYDVANDNLNAEGGMITRLLEVEQSDESVKFYKYAEPGLSGHNISMTGIVGEDGQRYATYKYDTSTTSGVIKERTRGGGLRKITYSTTSSIQDAYGNQFNYSTSGTSAKPSGFTNQPCPPEVCSGEGAQLKAITWDIYGNPLTKTDYNNRVTTLTWDGPRALPLTITQATGTALARTTTFTWHATKRLPLTKVEPIRVGVSDGTRTTTWAYDSNGLLLSETQTNSLNAQTRVRSFTYNTMGLVETATDARGKITEYTYDIQGNLLTQENALGQIITWSSYTPRGLPGKMTDPNGMETVITYDARDRITQIKRGSTILGAWETWNVAWLPIGKIDRITRPDGISYKLLYDSAHDLIEMQERSAGDTLLGKRVFTLDLMGRLTKEEAFDANDVKIASGSKVWNTLSRLYQTKGAQNQTTTLTYDADGNITGVSDPLTHTNGATVDALGRTVSTIDALNKTSILAYDVQDNLVSATDARSVVTGYGYNAFNDLLAISSADRGDWSMTVDANGNTIQTTDPRGVEASVVYDDLNRPVSMSWSDDNVASSPSGFTPGDKTALYTWDTCTNGIGRLCAKTDWTGAYGYSYDIWERLNGESFLPAGESFSLANGYSFDAFGRLVAQTYPSGKALTFTYTDGRVSSMQWVGAALVANMTHQPMGGATLGWTWAATGIPSTKAQVSYTYDLDGRMTHISDIEEIELTYDAANRLGAVVHQPNADPDMAYTYDAKDRLTQADNSTWTAATSYAYDFGDNRTSRTQGGDGWSNGYGVDSNRLISVAPVVSGVAGIPISHSYDAMGNLIHNGSHSYSYDAAGRMVAANAGASGATYQVNASGLRVRKDVSGVGAHQELVAYNGGRQRVGAYRPNGSGGFNVEEELVYLPGSWRLLATVRGQVVGGSDGVAYHVLSDQIGTPRVVLDPATGERW